MMSSKECRARAQFALRRADELSCGEWRTEHEMMARNWLALSCFADAQEWKERKERTAAPDSLTV